MADHIANGDNDYDNRRQGGFTLIELLVVLAVIASLLTIVAPRFFDQTDLATETVLKENLFVVRRAIDLYRGDTGRYPDSLNELVESRYLREIPVDPVTGRKDTWQAVREFSGITDIRSGAPGLGGDGTAYASW